MKLTSALAMVAGFVGKQQLRVVILTSALDGLISALGDDAMEHSIQVSHIPQQLIFFAVMPSVVKADEPPEADAVDAELTCDEAFDIPFQLLGLLQLFLYY